MTMHFVARIKVNVRTWTRPRSARSGPSFSRMASVLCLAARLASSGLRRIDPVRNVTMHAKSARGRKVTSARSVAPISICSRATGRLAPAPIRVRAKFRISSLCQTKH